MKRFLMVAGATLLLGAGGLVGGTAFWPTAAPVVAAGEVSALETASFAVEGMWCALCPLTVKTAIERVEGVREVVVDYQSQSATVTFDPALTNDAAIAAASTNAGYPAARRG